MDRKIWIGGGAAAALLSLGMLIGGVTTGMVGAQSPAVPSAPGQRTSQGAEAETPDTPVSLPAGSVSADAAKQAALAYIQQTAPYNMQGLSATRVKVDGESGAAVYSVKFKGANGQAAEVTVSPQCQVLKAEADNGHEQAGADAETADDGPGGAGNAAPNSSSPAGNETAPH
jgi:hypothetical protein